MCAEKNQDENEDLKAFEAALGDLRPRTDRLDARWRSRLAEEASFLPSPSGRGAGGEGCEFTGAHRYVCLYCGDDAPITSGVRRWALPAALSAMTTVAAALLVMLVARPAPPMAAGVDDHANSASFEKRRSPENTLAKDGALEPRRFLSREAAPYLALRDQVLRDGVESWQFPVSAFAPSATATTESPVTYREQLDRLLKQQGSRGSG
jgi:hypothetical protein